MPDASLNQFFLREYEGAPLTDHWVTQWVLGSKKYFYSCGRREASNMRVHRQTLVLVTINTLLKFVFMHYYAQIAHKKK